MCRVGTTDQHRARRQDAFGAQILAVRDRIARPGTARSILALKHRELGKHPRTAPDGLILQLGGHGQCPWLSVDDRCRPMLRARRGHVRRGRRSSKDDVARSLLATVASWIGGRGLSSVTACFAGKRPEDVRQCKRQEPEDLVLAERGGLDAGSYSYFGEALPRPDPLLVEPLPSCHGMHHYRVFRVEVTRAAGEPAGGGPDGVSPSYVKLNRGGKGVLPAPASDQQMRLLLLIDGRYIVPR
jgi:hypothetical protein